MTVDKEVINWLASDKALNHSRHEISNNDEIAHTDSKAFNRNSSIENYGGVGISQLRQREEGSASSIKILRAS